MSAAPTQDGSELINHSDIEWSFKSFDALSVREFYELLKLRIEVFVVEQDCAYAELDEADQAASSIHVQGYLKNSGQLIACARILSSSAVTSVATTSDTRRTIKIGRVAVAETARRQGVARALMLQVLRYIDAELNAAALDAAEVTLSAQTYIEDFYQSLGFKTVSGEYLEDGIPHLDMVRSLKSH